MGAPPTLGLAYTLGEFLKNSDFALLYLFIFTLNSNATTSPNAQHTPPLAGLCQHAQARVRK
jgi:hypothetical protein